jgi:hypothetical protein
MIKTKEFEINLRNKLYQYTINNPPVLLGSFKYSTYISDIDCYSFVRFDNNFIHILINTLTNLKDFKFIYLNAGIDQRFKLPWIINEEVKVPFGADSGCNFNLNKSLKWFEYLRQQNILPTSTYTDIYNILNKKKLILGDLIDIQDIIYKYSSIQWFLPDIIKGSKIVGNNTYILLDELKKEDGPVLNSIYIDGDNVVSVDIGLVDKKYKKPIWSRMYKYYTKNWYQILKSYKKLISTDFHHEYRNAMKTMEIHNSVLAQAKLLESLIKYNVFIKDSNKLSIISKNLETNLDNIHVNSNINLKEIQNILVNTLNNKARPYVDYFLDKLTNTGKISTYMKLRILDLSQIAISKQVLINRTNKGVICPFFKEEIEERIEVISTKLMMDKNTVKTCFLTVSQKEKYKSLEDFLDKNFNNSPISRLFLEIKNNNLYIRGAFIQEDHIFLDNLGEKFHYYYTLDKKYTKRIQIYLLTGK